MPNYHTPKEKIRVVFGLNDFLVGGMQKQFSEQVRHFDRARFEIILVTLFQFPVKEDLYATLPTDLPVYQLAFKSWLDVGEWLKLYRLLQNVRPHIVVSSLFFSNTVFRILKLPLRFVSIAREHNTYIHKTLLQRTLDRLLAHVSYKIVAVSTTVAEFTSAQEHISQNRFVTIHNGIDVNNIRLELERLPSKDSLKKEFNLLPTDRVLLNVARLTKQKNHKLLIDEFAHLYKKHPEYKLAIVGGGELQQELEQQADRSGVGGAVRFFGHQSDTFRFYKIADVFVSASDIEGLSNSYLKALAAGLPLVATKTAGTDELVKDGWNGFFMMGESEYELVRAIEQLSHLDEELLQKRSLETAEHFSIQKTVTRYQSLFEECML